jgi:hypothetical protein
MSRTRDQAGSETWWSPGRRGCLGGEAQGIFSPGRQPYPGTSGIVRARFASAQWADPCRSPENPGSQKVPDRGDECAVPCMTNGGAVTLVNTLFVAVPGWTYHLASGFTWAAVDDHPAAKMSLPASPA